jgi:hypothetical protein
MSNALPSSDQVPGLEAGERVYAIRLGTGPTGGKGCRAAICDDNGRVVSTVLWNDAHDLLVLARLLKIRGYVATWLGDASRVHAVQ